MWSYSTVAVFDLLYHIVSLIVVFIHRKNLSSASEHHTAEGLEEKSSDYFDMAPLKPPSIAFSKWNILSLTFLLAVNFIAFSVMANETTILGVMGGKPLESLGLPKWDLKILVTLTVILGCELLTIATTLGISAWGRRRIILEEENRLQEAQYEF